MTISLGVIGLALLTFTALFGHSLFGESGERFVTSIGGLILGARYNLIKPLSGDIAEMLVYDSALPDADRKAIEAYLLEKHPITTPLTAEDGGGYATDKINYSIQWFRNNFSIGYLGEYISAIDAQGFCSCGNVETNDPVTGNPPAGYLYFQEVDSLLYHDIVANYQFESTGTNIAVGVTNLTDEEPEYVPQGVTARENGNTYPGVYDPLGQYWFLGATVQF